MQVKLAPSILTADFSELGQQVRDAVEGGADYMHLDVMDGHFVPNITFGSLVLTAVRKITDLPLDIHLMITDPDTYVDEYAKIGGDLIISVHVEAVTHLHRSVQKIKSLGARAGVVLNPATPLVALEEILPYIDQVMIMSINPGFGGQPYLPTTTDKVRRCREMITARGLNLDIEVDGGISVGNIAQVVAAGANVLVTGSSVYNPRQTPQEALAGLRAALQGGAQG